MRRSARPGLPASTRSAPWTRRLSSPVTRAWGQRTCQKTSRPASGTCVTSPPSRRRAARWRTWSTACSSCMASATSPTPYGSRPEPKSPDGPDPWQVTPGAPVGWSDTDRRRVIAWSDIPGRMLFEVRGHLHSTITKALATMDRDLNETGKWERGGDLKYMLGKRYLRERRFAEAYAAFGQAEPWLADEKGNDHQHVLSAIMRQAQ